MTVRISWMEDGVDVVTLLGGGVVDVEASRKAVSFPSFPNMVVVVVVGVDVVGCAIIDYWLLDGLFVSTVSLPLVLFCCVCVGNGRKSSSSSLFSSECENG
jgi:hypothetical protein